MGILVAMKYPTALFLKAADHTYVQCGTGAVAWSCWGGKTGGMAFNSGTGSTNRANSIAQPNERAGITCYLVNGVCHQAANRILLPANRLVIGARGYSISSALFGAYGKTGLSRLPCYAPFNTYPEVTGDIPACTSNVRLAPLPKLTLSTTDSRYLRSVKQAYNKFDAEKATRLQAMQFQIDLFEREVRNKLGDKLGTSAAGGLHLAKEQAELRHLSIVESFANNEMKPAEFIKAFNKMTLDFQDDLSNAINERQYVTLFDLKRDERILLADPAIIESLYGKATVKGVYGTL